MTFGGRFVLNIIHFAAMQGVPLGEMLRITGHSEKELSLEETRIDSERYDELVEQIVFKSRDAYFGLHAGEQLNLAAAGLIAQITQTSRTVKEALEYCCEFAMLGCRAIPLELRKEGDLYALSMVPDSDWNRKSPLAVRQTLEGMLAFTLREFHTLSLRKRFPVHMRFDFDQPEDDLEYQRIFQCPLQYGQAETAFYFRAEDIEQPTATSNYELLRILVDHAREKLEDLQGSKGFQGLVRQSILNLMDPQFPTLESIASNLNLSVRTLQRRLAEEGLTYKDILEEMRRDLAMGYLNKKDLQVNEIADLLNYSDASTFIRSFKRWTGLSPQQYRKNVSSKRA